jgi:hypothetical protein
MARYYMYRALAAASAVVAVVVASGAGNKF